MLQYYGDGITTSNVWDDKDLFAHINDGVTVFESCFGSELILLRCYITVFAGWMLRRALVVNNLYNPVDAVNVTASISHVLDDILSHDTLITSGAGHRQHLDDKKDFVGIENDTMDAVSDKPQARPSHDRFLKAWLEDDNKTLVVELRQLGAPYAGFNGYAEDWFEHELRIAAWYRNHELNDSMSLIKLGERKCLQMTQTVWIMTLQKKPVISHLVFMSMEDPDDPATLVPTVDDVETKLAAIMLEKSTTFFSLLKLENGKQMMKDSAHCFFGWSTLGVNATDGKARMWRKLHSTVNEALQIVETIHDQMNAAIGSVTNPGEYLTDSRASSSFTYLGPAVYWRPLVLSVGLMRLSSKLSPTSEDLQPLRKSLVCYNSLETRFLNISTRCWVEPLNKLETRLKSTSKDLRQLWISMWSPGVVLNCIGAVVAMRNVRHIVQT
ncbi:TPA: hypothetical protein N0F65_006584 [Lagenidium giganteum]|uniref:Uncharacterized protein n=1 Tax=Lagenidium giganteum TaxID=4803 RepID=A0AAV2ZBC1_9STRA|nr:TPA: hypothetical protein N0F65_006584 [Lagenidium giganteum]